MDRVVLAQPYLNGEHCGLSFDKGVAKLPEKLTKYQDFFIKFNRYKVGTLDSKGKFIAESDSSKNNSEQNKNSGGSSDKKENKK